MDKRPRQYTTSTSRSPRTRTGGAARTKTKGTTIVGGTHGQRNTTTNRPRKANTLKHTHRQHQQRSNKSNNTSVKKQHPSQKEQERRHAITGQINNIAITGFAAQGKAGVIALGRWETR
ncbi:hypothetical protein E2C01_081756 [Portunus trituberculatus]|uniref:Uncharacterized protein n=1 Tax=Portunus trituberculatus TaxID=210409 RepID=A0A5B7IZQ4_PORTR|nr:hypothetical protein [Portunus trituberculatus]